MAREPVTFRLTPETKRLFFSKLALRGQKAQDFLEQTVKTFLGEESAMTTNCQRCNTPIQHGPDVKPTLCHNCLHLATGGTMKAGDGWAEIFPHARQNPETCNCTQCQKERRTNNAHNL